MIVETETRNEILRVYNWWRILNYGNYGNLDERDSFPFLVPLWRIFRDFENRIFLFRGEFSRIQSVRMEIFTSYWSSIRGRSSSRDPNIHTSEDIFENSIYLYQVSEIFTFFPTFPIKFISHIRLWPHLRLSRNIIYFTTWCNLNIEHWLINQSIYFYTKDRLCEINM